MPSLRKKPAPPAAPTRRPTKGSRYTPPAPKTAKSSHLWVPVTMFTCLVLGVIVIAGNYMQLLPGGDVSNNFLLIGLALLVSGFVLSTFFR
ncbi:MAG: Cell division protein CrgA [Actinomycetota bacterium]|nr:Cell division protein CrgA [Actinomycetota bacterium]